MKQLFFYILISLLPAFAYAQYTTGNKPQSAGDRIESTSYNDHKRGAARTLQYRPDGEDFVSVNGKNRYTRALYGIKGQSRNQEQGHAQSAQLYSCPLWQPYRFPPGNE